MPTAVFLPRDASHATQSAVMPQCDSIIVWPFRYGDLIGWNSSKIISRRIA